MITDPVSRIRPAVGPGDRVTVRHRIGEAATDVIGWVERLDPETITLGTADGRIVVVDRSDVLLARRVPPAAGGPDPLRVPADRLQRLAAESWIDARAPLGEWLLRDADGFTRRANSALAVGDPGMSLSAAATAVIDFYAGRGRPALAQVIAGDPVDRGLRALGWTDGGPDTDLMVVRLSELLGADRAGAREPSGRSTTTPTTATTPRTAVESEPGPGWIAALAAERGIAGPLGPAALRVIRGDGAAGFAGRTQPGSGAIGGGSGDGSAAMPLSIGRGHRVGDWLGVSAVWTDPAHRRRGHATAVLRALAAWGARSGARYGYLQVEVANAPALLGYQRLGFRRHHGYRYLTPPDR